MILANIKGMGYPDGELSCFPTVQSLVTIDICLQHTGYKHFSHIFLSVTHIDLTGAEWLSDMEIPTKDLLNELSTSSPDLSWPQLKTLTLGSADMDLICACVSARETTLEGSHSKYIEDWVEIPNLEFKTFRLL